MAGRYSPPPAPPRQEAFNPLSHLLKHLQDSPPTTPAIFTPIDLQNNPNTHDPEDILRELRTDGEHPFPIDRNVLKKVVQKKMRTGVDAISFLSSGTFHKAFMVTLDDGREIVARIARRYMPRLKTESEVATINYVRQNTNIPVPTIYHYDSNPYSRLGGEYILMSKAPGVPLSRVYHQFSPEELRRFFENLATILITLFSHRFSAIGSLYQQAPTSRLSSSQPQNKFKVGPIVSWPFFGGGRGEYQDIARGPWYSTRDYLQSCVERELQSVRREGEGTQHAHRPHLPPDDDPLSSDESDTGTVPNTPGGIAIPLSHALDRYNHATGSSSAEGPVMMKSSGSALNLSGLRRPGYKRHHSHRGAGLTSLVAASASASSYPSPMRSPHRTRSPSPVSESSSEEEGFYDDHRAHLRSSLLVAHQARRLEHAQNEMQVFLNYMLNDLGVDEDDPDFSEFSLDLHDLSLTNVFVDPEDLGEITCVIDWESTAIRPLWQCAHLPSFLASDPTGFYANLFREVVAGLGTSCTRSPAPDGSHSTTTSSSSASTSSDDEKPPKPAPLSSEILHQQAELWLRGETEREKWRKAHKVVEWDGWEEGLVASILEEELRGKEQKEPTTSVVIPVNHTSTNLPGALGGEYRGVGVGGYGGFNAIGLDGGVVGVANGTIAFGPGSSPVAGRKFHV